MILEMVAKKAGFWAAKKLAGAAVDAYKEFKKSAEEKAVDRIDPCQPCKQTKEERRRARQNAIHRAEETLAKGDLPTEQREELQRSVDRFKRNNEAVEYARLSAHAYDQYDPSLKGRDPTGPPEGWEVVDPKTVGLDPALVAPDPPSTFRAVVYRNTFGMEPEYSVAFRGTETKAGQNDINVDVQNAAGRETTSYNHAKKLAVKLREAQEAGKMGPFAVTGHSLGGGLAQTAGAQSDPPTKGFMFNSAGAHPKVAGTGKTVPGESFSQFRSPCDPLTAISGTSKKDAVTSGLQEAARLVQTGLASIGSVANALGFGDGDDDEKAHTDTAGDISVMQTITQVMKLEDDVAANKSDYGWFVPPNAGTMHQVSSYDNSGKEVPCLDLGEQHSVGNLTNGMEREKAIDLLVMDKHGAGTLQAKQKP